MPTGFCFYCNKQVETKLLKRCGACRAVTYCHLSLVLQSKECQKQAWKLTHKYNCMPISVPAGLEALSKPRTKIITAWQNEWSGTLDTFAILALDLENNPGKNVTHCMWLEFKYTGCEGDPKIFRVTGGTIRSNEEVLAESPQLHLMRDQPRLVERQVRYVMVFHFVEEGKPGQSFIRARSLVSKNQFEPPKGQPAGWEVVLMVIQDIF